MNGGELCLLFDSVKKEMALDNHHAALQDEKNVGNGFSVECYKSEGGKGRLRLINHTLFSLARTHYLFTGAFSQYAPASGGRGRAGVVDGGNRKR